jgi:ABC-type transport system involved in multi-copper enzyme maturation permease subunit
VTFLPIVERELRVQARRRSTYGVRVVIALVGLIVGGWAMLVQFWRSPQVLGIVLFYWLAGVTLVYAALAGVLSTADCLSEEKREGTLGLLFLTDLKGYDIVFGKLAATSLNTLYGMLAIFPVLAIPLLIGGVSGTEFWRVAMVCLNSLFFSLAAGMFCSAISRDERRAMALAAGLVLFSAAGLPLLGALFAEWSRAREPAPLFFIPSLGFMSVMAFEEPLNSLGKQRFWFPLSVLCVHLLGWALLALACLIVPRTWHDRAETPAAARRRAFWQRLAHGSAETRRVVRERLLAINPFYWLAGRDRFKSALVWLVLGAGGVVWALGLKFAPQDWKHAGAYFTTMLIAHTMLKLWVGSEAVRRLAADRKSGALELLLSTPLPVGEIVRGQWLALLRQFGGPALAVLLADGVFALAERRDRDWVWTVATFASVFLADLITLGWLGMWLALRSRGANRAAGAAFVRVLVLPWMVFLAVLTPFFFGAITQTIPRWLWSDERLLFALGLAIALGLDLVFSLHARGKLMKEFRAVAAQRFAARQTG